MRAVAGNGLFDLEYSIETRTKLKVVDRTQE